MTDLTFKPSIEFLTDPPNKTPISTEYIKPLYRFNAIPTATGSIYAENELIKCTIAIYGPKAMISSGFSEQGVVTCDLTYNRHAMESVHHNNVNKAKLYAGKTPQETEMTTTIQQVLSSAIQLRQLQKHEICVSISIHQSSLCHWYDLSFILNAVSVCLSTTGIPLFDMITSSTIYHYSATQSPTQQSTISLLPPLVPNPHQTSMVITYLPSLNQITFSKLQGQLATAKSDSSTTLEQSWATLSSSALETCLVIHKSQRDTLKSYVEEVVAAAQK